MAETDQRIARLEQRLERVRATRARIQVKMLWHHPGNRIRRKFGVEAQPDRLQRLSERSVELAADEVDILDQLDNLRTAEAEGRALEDGNPGDVRIEIPAAVMTLKSRGSNPPYRWGKIPALR